MPFVYLIAIFLWIWAEIEAFVALGDTVGVLLTLIGIFVTGMIGISLLRSQGQRIAGELQATRTRSRTVTTTGPIPRCRIRSGALTRRTPLHLLL